MSFSLIAQNNGNGKGKGHQKDQGVCGNENPTEPETASSGGNTCDVDLSGLPTKYVRVTVHVFQKNDSTGNIPNNSTGRNWITNMINSVNSDMGNLQMMHLSNSNDPSPYFQDVKIRYVLKNTYFWTNTSMWQKGNNTSGNGGSLYSYVQGQSISYKSNSIHILIPGNYANDGLGAHGIASGIGDKKWSLLEDVYHYYTNGNTWDIPNMLQHELGHNLNLYHSWGSDQCNDTPTHNNCWNGSSCSNNMMDYNACKCALTLDQATRMHLWLQSAGSGLVQSGQYSAPTITGTIYSSGYTGPLYCCTQNIGASSASITISSPSGTTFDWSKLGGTGSFSSSGNGYNLNLNGVSSINMGVTYSAGCVDKTYTFYNGGAYFTAGPNPTTGDLTIEVKRENELAELSSQISGKKVESFIEKITVYGKSGEAVQSIRPDKKSVKERLDLSVLEQGTYYLVIENGKLQISKPILKM